MKLLVYVLREKCGIDPFFSHLKKKRLIRSVTKPFFVILICLLFSSGGLIAQNQDFDPDDLVPEKLQEIKNLEDDELLVLTDDELEYISTNVEGIKATIDELKKAMKKSKALNKEAEFNVQEAGLEKLRSLRKSYTLIMHSTSTNI